MIKVTRRSFLKGTAATGAAVALSGTVFNTLRPARAEAAETGSISYKATGCLGCTTWCAVEAKVQDGRVVDVKGNRYSKSNAGYVCPRGRMGIQQMYDPDRIKVPMMRTNDTKGRGVNPNFIPVTWDEAITDIAEEMIDMRYTPDLDHVKHEGLAAAGTSGASTLSTGEVFASADLYNGYLVKVTDDADPTNMQIRMITASTTGGVLTVSPALSADISGAYAIAPSESHKLAVFRGRYTAVNDVTNAVLYQCVPEIFGTPNKVSHSSICAESEKGAAWCPTIGDWAYQDYDLDNCQCLLLWGVDPTSSNRMVPNAISKLGAAMAGENPDGTPRAAGAMKLIVVDPRLSPAAAKADLWAPVKPGTDGALALGIANWIVTNNLYHADFVTNRTTGLSTWSAKELAARTPAWAAGITGISATDIKKMACMFAGWNYDTSGNPTTQVRTGDAQCQAASWVGPGIAMQPNGYYGAYAAAALNGLVGSFDHLGGVITKKGSISSGTLIASTAYQDALSKYKGAYMGGTQKRTYAGLDPNALTTDYTDSTAPAVPLGLPGFKNGAIGGVTPTNMIGDALDKGYPYGLGDRSKNCRMIISHFANFPFSCSGADRWERGLSETSTYQVCCTTHASEAAMYADIVLPSDQHQFENYLFSAGQRANLANIVSMMQPVVERLWDTKWCETEMVWDLAQKMAGIGVGEVVEGWPTDYYFTGLKDYVDAYGTAGDSWEFNILVQKKWAVNNDEAKWNALLSDTYTTTDAYGSGYGYGILQAVVDRTPGGAYFDANGRGANWNGTAWAGTASGKVEFFNATSKMQVGMAAHASSHGKTIDELITACNYEVKSDPDLYYMPHYDAPAIAGSGDYKYTFVDYKSRLNQEGRTANCSLYSEFKVCDSGDEKWKDVVKLNPADAAAIGVVDGNWVEISSPPVVNGGTGKSIKCQVKVWNGVKSGTVAKCYGQGHWAYGRIAKGKVANFTNGISYKGSNNNELLPGNWERLVGGNVRNGCIKVKIVKIAQPYTVDVPMKQMRGY